jgi:tetratricopeptide (TPR) repeat protein
MIPDARALVEQVRARFPDAVRLAQAVSLATRIEPELLRQTRLKLLPDLDAGAEADLWFSPLVQSATPLAFVFLPKVADLLRRQLAQSKKALRDSWAVLEEAHRSAPAAIKLEERVTWQALFGGALAQQAIEKDLLSVVSAIVEQNRSGLARWALRALPKLPTEARQTKAATTLLLTAAAHLGAWQMLEEQFDGQNLPADYLSALRVVLPPDLPTVPVGVRLLEARGSVSILTISASVQRYSVEFSHPPIGDSMKNIITLPGTNPLLLEVSWDEDGGQQIKHLSLYQGQIQTIEVAAREIRIRTAGGDIYTLREDTQQAIDKGSATPTPILFRIPPPPPFGYVARTDDQGRDVIEQLNQVLASKTPQQIVALSGMGGIGKTVVAAETVRRMLEVVQQRVVWISAEGRSDFNHSVLLDEIAIQLNRPDLRTLALQAKSKQVRSLLNSASTLVVFDQFETISSNEQRRCLNFLKDAKCMSLIVTRQRIRGAQNLVLSSMTVPEADEFLERLISRSPDSKIFNELNRRLLYEISDRNPLAMQLIVAQITLTLDANEVMRRVLRGRGETIARVFERSFNLPELGDEGQAALLALSLFVPSASKQALAEVANLGKEVEHLNELVRRLTTLQLVNTAAVDERLFVEGLIRDLLQARLNKDKRSNEFRRRFVAYFLTYVQSRQESTSDNYDALEREFENLLDAMDMAFMLKDWESVIQLCTAIGDFLDVRGYWDEALRRNEQAQKAARLSKRSQMLPQLTEIAANILVRREQFKEAEMAYAFVLERYRKIGEQVGIARALRQLGNIALELKRLTEAEKLYNESLQIGYRLDDQTSIADGIHNLAIVAQVKGDLKRAQQLYEESLDRSQRLNDQRSVAISLHQLGVIAQAQGDVIEAERRYRASLDLEEKLGDRNGVAGTLHQMGLLKQDIGNLQESEQLLGNALNIFEELGSPVADEVRQNLKALRDTRVSAVKAPKKTSRKFATKSESGKKKTTSSKKKRSLGKWISGSRSASVSDGRISSKRASAKGGFRSSYGSKSSRHKK